MYSFRQQFYFCTVHWHACQWTWTPWSDLYKFLEKSFENFYFFFRKCNFFKIGTCQFEAKNSKANNFQTKLIWQHFFYIKFPFKWYTICIINNSFIKSLLLKIFFKKILKNYKTNLISIAKLIYILQISSI